MLHAREGKKRSNQHGQTPGNLSCDGTNHGITDHDTKNYHAIANGLHQLEMEFSIHNVVHSHKIPTIQQGKPCYPERTKVYTSDQVYYSYNTTTI